MNEFISTLQNVERSLSDERGAFNLFALFQREDAPATWDLLIAAPWIEKDKAGALRRVSTELQTSLDQDELLKLSRVVIIDQSNPALKAFQRAIHVEHSDREVRDSNFFGQQIRHAHIITSRQTDHA